MALSQLLLDQISCYKFLKNTKLMFPIFCTELNFVSCNVGPKCSLFRLIEMFKLKVFNAEIEQYSCTYYNINDDSP